MTFEELKLVPELLKALGDKLMADQYDIKPLIRDICTSYTYQLDTRRNESNHLDERHFSHGRIRRMRAEVLLDCLNRLVFPTHRQAHIT